MSLPWYTTHWYTDHVFSACQIGWGGFASTRFLPQGPDVLPSDRFPYAYSTTENMLIALPSSHDTTLERTAIRYYGRESA